jgi:hypothetical protein
MEAAAKPAVSTAHRVRLAISGLLFVVFVVLLGFGIVVYGQTTTQVSGLAMAVIGILGIAVLATSLRLARAHAMANRRGVYTGGWYGVTGMGNAGRVNQHDYWFQQHIIDEQRRRDDEYQQQQMWNNR